MVGKPNFPDDVGQAWRPEGSAVGTPGLTALDEEREASLADEGGASGAMVESQDLETLRKLAQDLPVAHLQPAETAEDCALERGRDDRLRGRRELRRRRSGRLRLSALGALRPGPARATPVTPGSSVETFALKSPYGFSR